MKSGSNQNGSSVKWLDFIYLCEALDAAGCPICTLVEKACYKHLDGLFYESVNDVGTRKRLHVSQGFCNWHAHLATRVPHTDSGIAIIYEDLLRGVVERVTARVAEPPMRHRSSVKLLPATAECSICETARFNEHVFLGELLRWFDDPELQTKYRPAFGLCLPHLQQALDGFRDHPQLPALLAAEREKLAALQAELQEFNRKRDYRFANEPKGCEQTAWRRVIEKFTGKREVFARAPRDGKTNG
jgi:Family of unknown function (DUF6062)